MAGASTGHTLPPGMIF
jgi:hypothetical protein